MALVIPPEVAIYVAIVAKNAIQQAIENATTMTPEELKEATAKEEARGEALDDRMEGH